MPHFYERNIVEIKNEYTTFLINIITPFIYEGLKGVYNYALGVHKKFLEREKIDPNTKSPGPLKIFQTCLKEIPALNNHSIEKETNKIKEGSKCSEWFDDLIKAVIKSHVILLTFSCSKTQSDVVKEKYHDRIDSKDFIHKCYIECAKIFYNYPELFWHEFPTIEIKRNQREIYDIIKTAIHEAIRKSLPIRLILTEYLNNDYIPESEFTKVSESKYKSVKELVDRDLKDKLSDYYNIDDKEDRKREDIESDHTNLLDDQSDNIIEVYEDKQNEDEIDIKNKLLNIQKQLTNENHVVEKQLLDENENQVIEKQLTDINKNQDGEKQDNIILTTNVQTGGNNNIINELEPQIKSKNKNNRRTQFLEQIAREVNTIPDIKKSIEVHNNPKVVQEIIQKNIVDDKAKFFAQYMK